MGYAFGISEDDVWAVLLANKVQGLSERQVSELFDGLDENAVESAALEEFDMDAQTDAAHAEIWRQIQNSAALALWRSEQAAGALEGALATSDHRPRVRI